MQQRRSSLFSVSFSFLSSLPFSAFLISFLLFSTITHAFSVAPEHIEIQDTGNERLPPLNVQFVVDCDSKQINASVISMRDGTPVSGADVFLFYTNYGYQLISTGKTGNDGIATLNVVGNMNYLTALFILRVDQSNFRSREIEFTYQKCFEGPSPGPQPTITPPQEPPQTQNLSQLPPVNESSENSFGNVDNVTSENTTSQQQTQQEDFLKSLNLPNPPCLPAFLLTIFVGFVLVKC